jgi:lipopolysaccharide assembly outer membrane protein LptD (OstA)
VSARRLATLVARLAATIVALLALAAPAAFAAAAPEPPFHIKADNMTGGRTDEGDILFLNGNLRVTRGGTVLTADNGRYARASGLIDLTGHVRLVDSTTTVTCDHATFSETDDRLKLDGNVVIVDRDAVLRAPYGWYDRKAGAAYLGGNVEGHEKKQRMQADEATYLRDSLIVKARGHVRGWDDENKVEMSAQKIDFYRRTKIAIATGEPALESRDDDGRLTTLRARLLRVNSETKIAEAIDSVLVERDTMRVRADRATFDDRSGHGFLYGGPRAWDNETVVTGDTLETVAEERRLRRVIVHGNATMDYAGIRETNAGETSRLTGKRVDVFVTENRIDSLLATGQAVNVYTSPGRPGRTQERNQADGDSILVWFKDRKVDRARVVGKAQGEYRAPVDEKDTVAVANEVVKYDGQRIDFIVPKNKIVLDGQAHLTYRELDLSARRVEFDSQKQTLVAQGKPSLLDRGDRVDGHLMTYDLETRTGTIYQAQTSYERGLYRGDRIRKASDKELDVMHGSYSTCDLDEPHYHFSSREMKVYLKDKLVAKPVVFDLRNVPVLALPFYVFPIKPGRHSGFLFPQFEFGFSNRSGQFLRNAGYYWAPNDYMDLSLAGDYYQAQPAWLVRGEGNYKLLYRFDGHFEGRFEHSDLTRRDDYVFDADHEQEVTPRTRLVARGNFISSRDYSRNAQSGATLQQTLNRFLTSTLSVSHSADWASVNAFIDRRQDLDADEAIKTSNGFGTHPTDTTGTFASLPNLTTSSPSVSVSFPTRTVGSWGVFKGTKAETLLASTYFSLNTQFLSLGTHRAYVSGWQRGPTDSLGRYDSTSVLGQQLTTRRGFQSSLSIADSRRLFGWLNATPSLSTNAALFDFDEQGHRIVPAATWSSQMGLSSTFYGTFKPPLPHVAGLRHIVTPSVAVSYSPEFPGLQYRDSLGVLRNRFNSFGNIGVSGFRSAFMSFGVDQRFQLKTRDGDKINRLDNLLSWSTTGSYDFLWSERHAAGTHPLGPINSFVVLQPPGLATGTLSGVFDVYSARPLRTLTYNTGFNLASSGAKKAPAGLAVEQTTRKDAIASEEDFRESWRVSIAYSYSGGYSGPTWSAQKTANGVLAYQLSPNWKLDYSTALDVTRRQVLSQRFSLTRRLHCWDAIFTRSFFPGGQAEYYFRLGVREQREIYYERGTRTQRFGGIQ